MEILSLSTLATQLVLLPKWEAHFDTLTKRLACRFAHPKARQQASEYLRGLLSPVERKNGWQLAEHLGHETPYRVQHLLDLVVWNADAVRDDLQAYVIEHLGHSEGVLVIDETGFLKKGDKSVPRRVCERAVGAAQSLRPQRASVLLGICSRGDAAVHSRHRCRNPVDNRDQL